MAVTTSNTIALSDVCLELYGSSNTSGRSLAQCHIDASGATNSIFDPSYAVSGDTLLDFRGYKYQPKFTSMGTTGSTSTTIDVTWTVTDNLGLTSMTLYYKTSAAGSYSSVAVTTSLGTQNYTLTGLQSSTTYNLYMTACDANGNCVDSLVTNRATSAGADTQAPTFTTQPNVTGFTKTSIDIAWVSTDNVGVTSQTVYYRVAGGGSYTPISVSAGATSYSLTGLTSGETYDIYVEACDAANNCTSSAPLQQQTTITPSISITPSSYNFGESGGNFTATVTSNTTWNISDNQSWLSTSGASGNGNDSLTVSATSNSGSSRSGTVTVTTTYSSGNVSDTISITQDAASAPLYGYNFSYGVDSGTACSGTYPGSTTYYIDAQGLSSATMIYSDSAGNTTAPDGWYSDGFNRRQATNGVLGNTSACR